MKALRNLGLNVVKANVYLDSSGKHNTFAITKAYFLFFPSPNFMVGWISWLVIYFYFRSTGRKVEDPELLEAIRLTIINNMIEYHPVLIMFLSIRCFFFAEIHSIYLFGLSGIQFPISNGGDFWS